LLLDALRHLAQGNADAAAVANPEALATIPGGVPAVLLRRAG
jgi:hypothetical protein